MNILVRLNRHYAMGVREGAIIYFLGSGLALYLGLTFEWRLYIFGVGVYVLTKIVGIVTR